MQIFYGIVITLVYLWGFLWNKKSANFGRCCWSG